MTTRVAAFDCGTNSLRVLIADLDPAAGRLTELARRMRIVRLGEGVDRTGRISADAMGRVLTALDEFGGLVQRHGVEQVRFVATSAARDADNAADFVTAVRQRLGVEPEVISGEAEARLSFAGAVCSLRARLPEPYLVADIGGGSTELIVGTASDGVGTARSLDIGSVRLTERHLHGDPPTRAQLDAVCAEVDAALDACSLDLSSAGTVIGVAGTVTTVAAGALRLRSYDRSSIDHAVIDVASVQGTTAMFGSMTVGQRRALGYMHPGRADVIVAGALILERLLRRTGVYSILVSEQDILDGIAWSLVGGARTR